MSHDLVFYTDCAAMQVMELVLLLDKSSSITTSVHIGHIGWGKPENWDKVGNVTKGDLVNKIRQLSPILLSC